MKCKYIIAAAAAVSFLACASFCAAGNSTDYWIKMERNGTGYGYEHVTVSGTAAGGFEYRVENRYKMDVIGLATEEIVSNSVCVTDKDLNPIEISRETVSSVKKSKFTAKRENGLLNMTSDDCAGTVVKKSFAAENIYAEASLPDLILKFESKGGFGCGIISPESLDTVEVKARITGSGSAEVVAEVESGYDGPRKYVVTRDGKIRSIESAFERIFKVSERTYLTDEKDARDIRALKTDDGSSLVVESRKKFDNVYRVKNATVRMAWKSIPFEKFSLEDNRQKVLSKLIYGGTYEVVLELSKSEPFTAEINVDKSDETLKPFLGETRFIKPYDPEIAGLAKKLSEGKTDAVVVVKDIMRWASENVRTEFIAETLSGPEILKSRRGKCSEFAVLFASLSRSAGIPTKISLGDLYAGGKWMGHMWNEVYIGGRWIAVDAGYNCFVSGPTHVKFVDSDTVMGTQGVRTKLIDNLILEIVDYETDAPTGEAAIKSGVDGLKYGNGEFRCEISAPGPGWSVSESKVPGATMASIRNRGNDGVEFALVLFPAPPGVAAEKILNARISALAPRLAEFKKLSEGTAEVGARSAARIVFRHVAGRKNKKALINENYMIAADGSGYLFAVIVPEDEIEKYRKDFDAILKSFRIAGPSERR